MGSDGPSGQSPDPAPLDEVSLATAYAQLQALLLETDEVADFLGTRPQQFDDAAIRRADGFSRQSATALTIMMRHASQLTLATQLREALASRAIIDQAIGVVMSRQHCNATEAFAVLRQASQHRNVKLSMVAAELIAAASGHPPHPPRPFTQRG